MIHTRAPLIRLAAPLLLALTLTACGGETDEAAADSSEVAAPTRAQRDSAIAESAIPGSGVVGAALDAAADAEARAQRHDTIR